MENLPGREHLEHAHQLTEDTAQRLIRVIENSAPVRRLRASQVLSALVGGIGFALFVGGVEHWAERTALLDEHPFLQMGIGLLLLVLTGLLIQKLRGGE